ncbi:MAG: lipopolysaccharide heptosyltransferase II [Gemmatimonadaceae bacterium]
MSSLVIQTSFLGDTVLTTPLIARLAERGPVDVLVTPASARLLANHPAIRETIVYDKRGRDRGVAGFARMARALRARRYDAAYLAQGSARSGALALAARVPRRVGFTTSAGRAFYTVRVPAPLGMHHAEKLFTLGSAGGGRPSSRDDLRPRLYPGPDERRAADELLGVRAGEELPLVALAPGSVWATKRWPYYPALARALAGRARLVIIGGREDGALAREIMNAAGDDTAIDATGRLTLLASAEVIGRARVIVSNDSAPLHLASAMGTPTVALFGPTVPAFGFGPLAARSAIVEDDLLACRPCDRHGPQRCPLGHWKCMLHQSPERVAGIVSGHLIS